MKNRRRVCNARDAGYIEYPGLPGRVKTGCMMTPQYESHYCSQHQIHSCNFDDYVELSDEDITCGKLFVKMYYTFIYLYTIHAQQEREHCQYIKYSLESQL